MLSIIILLFTLLSLVTLAGDVTANSETVILNIIHDDGGKKGKRHTNNLLTTLNNKGCKVILPDPSSTRPAQIIFDSRPSSIVKKEMPDYQFIARAKTLYGQLSVRGAILIHASRGISDLSLLTKEWIGFVHKNSWSGYILPVQLLKEAGVNEKTNTFYFIDNHVGPVSGLLHRDVTIAVIAEPLAQRWAEMNGLSIVAITEAVETGGWWMHHNVSEKMTQNCIQAITGLERSQHKALPAWIDGFVDR
jgi:hypothetical protein